METRFTPGPWYSRPNTLRETDTCVATTGGVICELSDGEIDPEQIANAALIAAAPCQHAALKDARDAIASLDEEVFGLVHDGHGGFLGFVRDELLAKIDAALSRALSSDGSEKT